MGDPGEGGDLAGRWAAERSASIGSAGREEMKAKGSLPSRSFLSTPEVRPSFTDEETGERSLSKVTVEAKDPRPSEGIVGSRSFLCPCRGPGGAGRAAAAGHGASAEREARGALEMRGAGPRDSVTGGSGRPGAWGCLASPPPPALGTRLACPSFTAASHLLCSSGNQLLGLKLEGLGSK